MNHRCFSRLKVVCVVGILGLSLWTSAAQAQPSSTQLKQLSQDVQNLQKTIEQLNEIVSSQQAQLQELRQKPGSRAPAKVQAPRTAPRPSASPRVATSTPATTPPASARRTRQYGFWEVPVNPQGPTRFLPDISVNGIFAAAYFTEDPGESGHNPSRTGFNMQEIELAIQSIIDPYIRADIFLAFGEEGVELEEAYITTLSLPKGLQVKAGKYLLPFGRQNQKHVESWAFVNDNLVNQNLLGDEGFNELGVELSYLFPTPFFFLAQGNFTQGTSEDNFDGGRRGDFAYTGRLSGSGEVAEDLTLLMGSSLAFGHNGTGDGNATYLVGGDVLLRWRPSAYTGIDWQTEYIYRRRRVPGALETEGGLYSYLLGQWTQRWGAGLRVGYLGFPSEEDKTLRLSPMVYFRTTEFFQIKAQYDLIDDEVMGVQHAGYLQWIFTMGPHAPHAF